MAPKCKICFHPDRDQIDKAIVSGSPIRIIADQYGVSLGSINRHKSHIPLALAETQKAEKLTQADDLLSQLETALKMTWEITNKCQAEGDNKTALQGLKEVREHVRFLCDIAQELHRRREEEAIRTDDGTESKTVILDMSKCGELTDDELLTLLKLIEKIEA